MTQRPQASKPYDIRERVFLFVLEINSTYPAWRSMEAPSRRAWSQLFNAASSGGAHLEEADAASSHRHFTVLNRGALRELREARYWLRLIVAGKLQAWQRVRHLANEAGELVAIMTTIVKNASAEDARTAEGS